MILILTMLTGCAARGPVVTFPGDEPPDIVLEGWARAQRELLELEPPLASDPTAVSSGWFTWIEQTRTHRCYGIESADGCFSTDHVIQYKREMRVVVHEARHAIAFAAGDPRWREIGHGEVR